MTPAETYVLGLLVEEGGEIAQLAGKAFRFGFDTPGRLGPDGKVSGETPRSLLHDEVGDMLAAVEFATAHGILDLELVTAAKQRKFSKLMDPAAKDNLGRPLAPQPNGQARFGIALKTVRAICPDARSAYRGAGRWSVLAGSGSETRALGHGDGELEAWVAAVRHLESVEAHP